MEIGVISATHHKHETNLALNEQVFGQEFNGPLIHQVVVAYMSRARAGTHAQKTRAEVSGGGTKPWKQKGMGRARAGTIRSPLWRTGGVTFAARTQDYSQKVNKKMFRGAMRSIFSELIRQDRLVVIDQFTLAHPKTKLLIEKLNKIKTGVTTKKEEAHEHADNPRVATTLIIADTADANLILAARNNHQISVCDVTNLSPVSLVAHETVLITSAALKKIEEVLS